MKYVRVKIKRPYSHMEGLLGEVVDFDDRRGVYFVDIPPIIYPLQFRQEELEEISEQEYCVALAAQALGAAP